MAKFIKYFFISLLIIALTAILVLTLSVNTIVKNGIEQSGSGMTGTSVTVARVSISPFSGRGEISGFRVANPDGYSREYAIEIDDFSIELDLWSLFSDEIVVHQIIITNPSIFVEQKLPENNLNTILQNIRATPAQHTTDADLVIERFRMTGASAGLYTEVGGERSAKVDIETLELEDLGRGGGRQAAEEVIKEIAEQVALRVLQGAAGNGVNQLLEGIRGLFE